MQNLLERVGTLALGMAVLTVGTIYLLFLYGLAIAAFRVAFGIELPDPGYWVQKVLESTAGG